MAKIVADKQKARPLMEVFAEADEYDPIDEIA